MSVTDSNNNGITEEIASVLNIKQIQSILMHRYPFLLIDKVTELHLGERILAKKNVTINEPFFQGHFPGEPIMPGVLTVEAMAQACGILAYMTMGHEKNDGSRLCIFTGIDKCLFKRQVLPGDVLTLEAELLASRCGIWKFNVKAHVDGQLACSAVLKVAETVV